MDYRLSPQARADGHRLHVHDTLGSTNAEALALARSGERGPLWIVAHRQSAGRGRRGTAWISPEGNLAASLLWPVPDVAPERAATLGFVAGLALVQALDDVAPPPATELLTPSGEETEGAVSRRDLSGSPAPAPSRRGTGGASDPPAAFRLKWPNDVLADGAKLAGILLEAEALPGGRRAVVIGFGVNVLAAPEGLPYAATSLAAQGRGVNAGTLFEALTLRFVEAARIWNKGHGFSSVRQLWLRRAAGIGAPVSVRLPDRTLSGTHDGIDEGGRLLILAPDGTTHTVTAGEVHFGGAATAA